MILINKIGDVSMKRPINRMIEKYKETKKRSLVVYFVLRALVILCMVLEILRGDLNNAFLCGLSLILFTFPTIIEDKFKITLPSLLEGIIYCFIFSAEILGEINNFYGNIPYWDTVLHTLNGFLAAGVGFSLIDLLNENARGMKLSPVFVAIVAFCFSMTIGVLWEFFEYGMDVYTKTDMQKDRIVSTISTVELNSEKKNKVVTIDNIKETHIITDDETIIVEGGYLEIGIIDTMKDLIVNFVGAVSFSTLGFLYITNREKYKFASNFIPQKNTV